MLTAGPGVGAPAAGAEVGADRRLRWWVEILLGLALFGVYLLVQSWPLPGNAARAMANGQAILSLERSLGTDFELPMNLWLADAGWLRVLANYEYAFTYVVTTLIVLAWLFVRRPEVYRWARDSFALLNLLALGCFWLYPVAPPRLLPDAGFVDTVRLSGTWGSWGSPMVDNANQLAAMPSLHIGWAVWVSVVLARIASGWQAQLASAVHVLITFLVIIATGNHYWLDAVAGALVVWLGVAGAGLRGHRVAEQRTHPMGARGNVGRLLLLDARREPGRNAAELRRRIRELAGAEVGSSPDPAGTRADLDWTWHLPEYDLGGREPEPAPAASHRVVVERAAERAAGFVAEFVARPLPVDRPPWRCALVTGAGLAAVVPIAAGATGEGASAPPRRLRLAVTALDERAVRDLALAREASVAQILLCGVAGALARVNPRRLPDPVWVSLGDDAGSSPVAVPVGRMPANRRLAKLAGASSPPPRARDDLALAGPEPLAALAGLPVSAAVPLVPPAAGAQVGLGALAVHGTVWVGVLLADDLGGDLDRFGARFGTELAELGLDSRRG